MASLWSLYVQNLDVYEARVAYTVHGLRVLCDEIDRRLTALEDAHNTLATHVIADSAFRQIPLLGAEQMFVQSSALEHSEAKPDGWIVPSDYVWVRRLRDGEIFQVRLSEVMRQPDKFTHIMPYHPGDPKPEPPKGDK